MFGDPEDDSWRINGLERANDKLEKQLDKMEVKYSNALWLLEYVFNKYGHGDSWEAQDIQKVSEFLKK